MIPRQALEAASMGDDSLTPILDFQERGTGSGTGKGTVQLNVACVEPLIFWTHDVCKDLTLALIREQKIKI